MKVLMLLAVFSAVASDEVTVYSLFPGDDNTETTIVVRCRYKCTKELHRPERREYCLNTGKVHIHGKFEFQCLAND